MKKERKDSNIVYVLLLLLTAVIWGIAFVFQAVGAQYVGPLTFLAGRSWIACAALLPVIWWRKKKKKDSAEKDSSEAEENMPASDSLSKALILGSLCCGAFLFFASLSQQAGISYTTAGKAGFITALYVVMVPLISLFFGKKQPFFIWISVALGVAGLYLLSIKGNFELGMGDALMILCALLFSFQILSVNHFAAKVDGVMLACGEFFVEAVLATAGMCVFEHVSADSIMAALPAILYAGLFSSGIGYTLQIVAQSRVEPTVASLLMCLESVFSALAGWVYLHESMTAREFLGAVLLFAAVVLSQFPHGHRQNDTSKVSV
ncbi:MAG: DMT family transporter [Lachnospiraceae bacterium]|nr:DMT family transporter [Lachnospiraceae bacterium]